MGHSVRGDADLLADGLEVGQGQAFLGRDLAGRRLCAFGRGAEDRRDFLVVVPPFGHDFEDRRGRNRRQTVMALSCGGRMDGSLA